MIIWFFKRCLVLTILTMESTILFLKIWARLKILGCSCSTNTFLECDSELNSKVAFFSIITVPKPVVWNTFGFKVHLHWNGNSEFGHYECKKNSHGYHGYMFNTLSWHTWQPHYGPIIVIDSRISPPLETKQKSVWLWNTFRFSHLSLL